LGIGPTDLVSLVSSSAGSALVQVVELVTETVHLTASSVDLGISSTAQIVLAELADGAIYVSSDLVIANDHIGMTAAGRHLLYTMTGVEVPVSASKQLFTRCDF
jgi:hypothetical protein